MNDPTFEEYSTEKRSSWGCLLGGCLSIAVLLAIALGAAGFLGYRYLESQIANYSSETADELPVVEYSEEQTKALNDQLDQLKSAMDDGAAVDPLVLTADDVNALIAQEETLRGKVFVRINDGQISGDLSIPLDNIPGGKGRFFNGSVTANVSLDNGILVVMVSEATVNGQPVPEQFMRNFRGKNLAEDANKDADAADVIQKIKRLEIVEDTIVLTPRQPENAPVEQTE